MKIIDVHISTLRIGDTVMFEGSQRTLSKSNFSFIEGMGRTIYGDSYQLGRKPVQRIIF